MVRLIRRWLALLLVFALLLPGRVGAQYEMDPLEPGNSPRRQMATIVIAGLAGGILGLSTLSFYGRPQDYLSNIAIGFALGVAVGTIYVTYRTARDPYEKRYQGLLEPSFAPITRADWASMQTAPTLLRPINLTWNF